MKPAPSAVLAPPPPPQATPAPRRPAVPALQEKPAAISRVFPPISQIILRYRSRSDPASLTPLTRGATGVGHSTRCPKMAGLPLTGLFSHGVPRVCCHSQPRLSQTKNAIDASTGPLPFATHPMPPAPQPRIATVFSLPSVLAYPTPSFSPSVPFPTKPASTTEPGKEQAQGELWSVASQCPGIKQFGEQVADSINVVARFPSSLIGRGSSRMPI